MPAVRRHQVHEGDLEGTLPHDQAAGRRVDLQARLARQDLDPIVGQRVADVRIERADPGRVLGGDQHGAHGPQDAAAAPVVARHEQRLQGGRPAGGRGWREREDDGAVLDRAQPLPRVRRRLVEVAGGGEAVVVRRPRPRPGVPVGPGAHRDHQVPVGQPTAAREAHGAGRGVDRHRLVAAPGDTAGRHPPLRPRDGSRRSPPRGDVRQQRSVAVLPARLDHDDVVDTRAAQVRRHGDPGVAASQDDDVVVGGLARGGHRWGVPAGPTRMRGGVRRRSRCSPGRRAGRTGRSARSRRPPRRPRGRSCVASRPRPG